MRETIEYPHEIFFYHSFGGLVQFQVKLRAVNEMMLDDLLSVFEAELMGKGHFPFENYLKQNS